MTDSKPGLVKALADHGHDFYTQWAIVALSQGNIKEGVEAICDLAALWKAAENPKSLFIERCQYIEDMAVQISGNEELRFEIKPELHAALVKMGKRTIIQLQ